MARHKLKWGSRMLTFSGNKGHIISYSRDETPTYRVVEGYFSNLIGHLWVFIRKEESLPRRRWVARLLFRESDTPPTWWLEGSIGIFHTHLSGAGPTRQTALDDLIQRMKTHIEMAKIIEGGLPQNMDEIDPGDGTFWDRILED